MLYFPLHVVLSGSKEKNQGLKSTNAVKLCENNSKYNNLPMFSIFYIFLPRNVEYTSKISYIALMAAQSMVGKC